MECFFCYKFVYQKITKLIYLYKRSMLFNAQIYKGYKGYRYYA